MEENKKRRLYKNHIMPLAEQIPQSTIMPLAEQIPHYTIVPLAAKML
jgi:hypothetical protein